jgi:hypothetical protein
MAGAKGRPPRHGDISVTTMPRKHMRAHLASMSASAGEVANYGGHSVTGEGSQGSFASGGASDYSTTNVGGTGDADTGGS